MSLGTCNRIYSDTLALITVWISLKRLIFILKNPKNITQTDSLLRDFSHLKPLRATRMKQNNAPTTTTNNNQQKGDCSILYFWYLLSKCVCVCVCVCVRVRVCVSMSVRVFVCGRCQHRLTRIRNNFWKRQKKNFFSLQKNWRLQRTDYICLFVWITEKRLESFIYYSPPPFPPLLPLPHPFLLSFFLYFILFLFRFAFVLSFEPQKN